MALGPLAKPQRGRISALAYAVRVAALMGASAAPMGLWRSGRGGDRVSRAIRSIRRTAAFDRKVIALFPPTAGTDWSRHENFLDTIVRPAERRLATAWDRYANDDGDLGLIVIRDNYFSTTIIFARVLNDEIVLWNFVSEEERQYSRRVIAGEGQAVHD
jgi:uncharacterized protein YbjT (DUF2867 family)